MTMIVAIISEAGIAMSADTRVLGWRGWRQNPPPPLGGLKRAELHVQSDHVEKLLACGPRAALGTAGVLGESAAAMLEEFAAYGIQTGADVEEMRERLDHELDRIPQADRPSVLLAGYSGPDPRRPRVYRRVAEAPAAVPMNDGPHPWGVFPLGTYPTCDALLRGPLWGCVTNTTVLQDAVDLTRLLVWIEAEMMKHTALYVASVGGAIDTLVIPVDGPLQWLARRPLEAREPGPPPVTVASGAPAT